MKTELTIGLVVLAGWMVVKFFKTDPAAKQIPVLIGDGALVVDVRTAGEFAGGHFEGAVNIPFDVISREIGKHTSDKNQAIILYCRSGARAVAAERSLKQAGYTRTVNASTLRKLRKLLNR